MWCRCITSATALVVCNARRAVSVTALTAFDNSPYNITVTGSRVRYMHPSVQYRRYTLATTNCTQVS